MSERSDGKSEMYSVINWQNQITDIAGTLRTNDTRESWLSRAAHRAGITFRQCKALYYGEMKNPKTTVAVRVLGAAEKARDEAVDLASRFETLAGAMNASDQDFYSADVVALINAARALRGLDRT